MGAKSYWVPLGDGGCALSVQKNNLILQMLKQLYIPSNPLLASICRLFDETQCWQGFRWLINYFYRIFYFHFSLKTLPNAVSG